MGKAAVFIDNGYLIRILDDHHLGARLDYKLFTDNICQDLGCTRYCTKVYDAYPYQSNRPSKDESKNYANKMRYFDEIRKLPDFKVKMGITVRDFVDGKYEYRQKKVDVQLALDMYRMAYDPQKPVDTIALISGDADFEPAVEYVRQSGVLMVLCPSDGGALKIKSYSDSLKNKCSTSRFIDASLIDRSLRSMPIK